MNVRELRNRPGRVWTEIETQDLVLTSRGSPVGLLVGVKGGDLEATLSALRRARAALAVSRIRRRAAERGTSNLTMKDIDREIRQARRPKRKR